MKIEYVWHLRLSYALFEDVASLARQLTGVDDEYLGVACDLCVNAGQQQDPTQKLWPTSIGPRMFVLFAQDDHGDSARHVPVIGVGILFVLPLLTGRVGRIESVVVDDAYRGQGIGKEITLRLIAKAGELGLDEIDLTSNPTRVAANALYQKLGFRRYDTNVYRLKLK